MTSIRRSTTLLALTVALVACTKSDKAPSTSSTSSSAAAATVTPGAVSSSSGLSAIDEAALRDFRLSDEKIAHTIQATDNIGALMKAHPELEDKMEAMSDRADDAKSLNEFVDR